METEANASAFDDEHAFPRSHIQRARLVEQWTPLVRKIAARYVVRLSRWYEFSDLVSMGQLILWHAARTHDPDGGAKFSTYAYHAIHRGYGALLKHWRHGKRRGSVRSLSFDECYDDGSPVREYAGDERSPEQALEVKQELGALDRLLGSLKLAERQVIRERFVKDRRLEDIAQDRGISRERVRQIEKTALRKLHRAMDKAFPGRVLTEVAASHRQVTPRAASSRRKVARPCRVT